MNVLLNENIEETYDDIHTSVVKSCVLFGLQYIYPYAVLMMNLNWTRIFRPPICIVNAVIDTEMPLMFVIFFDNALTLLTVTSALKPSRSQEVKVL